MTIGVIYCETLDAEIKAVAADVPQVEKLEVMPWGLHIDPDRLLAEVRDKILQLQERVEVIVLGYGRCQALDRLGDDFKVPVLRPEAEDCIGVLMGQQRYEEELQREPGTWFLSPGWTRMGTDFVFRELQVHRIGRKDIDPLQLARRMLEGFTRALYIDMNLDRKEGDLAEKARLIATDLALRLERTTGSCGLLKAVFDRAVALSVKSSALQKKSSFRS